MANPMKYQVKVDEQTFEVEIVDLHERPIRVLVDGESFDIWPKGQAHPGVAIQFPSNPGIYSP